MTAHALATTTIETKPSLVDTDTPNNITNVTLTIRSTINVPEPKPSLVDTTPNNNTNVTLKIREALCIVDQYKHFKHFPHAAEQLFPCWSFFQSNPTHKCALALPSHVPLSKGWVQDVVQAMECNIYKYDANSSINDNNNDKTINIPNNENMVRVEFKTSQPKPAWFRNHVHAQRLTEKIFKYYGTNMTITNNNKLSILFIQRSGVAGRSGNRILVNLEEIMNATQKAIPHAKLIYADMAKLSTVQQVELWNQVHIVFAAHGAACTNVAFMRPQQSALMEIFPPEYKVNMFKVLAERVQVKYLAYATDKQNETVYPTTPVPKNQPITVKQRNVDLYPNVTAMVELIQNAVESIGSIGIA